MLFYNYLILAGLFSMILWIGGWILIRLTLDRRVRKSLPRNKKYDSYMDKWLGIGRAITFAWCAIIPNKKHAEVVKIYYNNINIYTFANWKEKFISYCLLGGFFIFITAALIDFALSFFINFK